ncbi:MAG: FtsX-like permease family protein, partial [Candidatus Thalassarchaeaceae archaeon]|nr:FtsX-like permease family protein [Candidatus Thalassarchaeaceae archaeon]
VNSHTSSTWFFELCDEYDKGCREALEDLNFQVTNGNGVSSVSDWGSTYDQEKRKGGLIFGTPGLLSLQFVVASLASIASAFVFLSLVLTQRKKELAIIQAIGGSHQQVFKTVLFEILSILLVSMGLGVILGLAIAQSFNGFFRVFGFIFQIFLGESTPIDRDLVWPWTELIIVNLSVLVSVMIALILTTRRALKSDLAVVLKGE